MRVRRLYLDSRPRGFTLLEVILCTVIVGVGFLAALQVFIACTKQNSDSLRMSVAASLANNMRQIVSRRSFIDPNKQYDQFGRGSDETDISQFNDIDDFDNFPLNPPVDAISPTRPQRLTDLAAYTQVVTVTPLDGSDFTKELATSDKTYTAARVRVDIRYKPNLQAENTIYSISWVECKR